MKKNKYEKEISDYKIKNSFIKNFIESVKAAASEGDEHSIFLICCKTNFGLHATGIDLSKFASAEERSEIVASLSEEFAERKKSVCLFGTALNAFGVMIDNKEMKGKKILPVRDNPQRKEILLFDFVDLEGNRYLRFYGVGRSSTGKPIFVESHEREFDKFFSNSAEVMKLLDGWIPCKDKKNITDYMSESLVGRAWLSYRLGLLADSLGKK